MGFLRLLRPMVTLEWYSLCPMVLGQLTKLLLYGLITHGIEYSDIKLTAIQKLSKAIVVIPKF